MEVWGLNTLINLSRLEDKLTPLKVNLEHPVVEEPPFAEIERTTIEIPIKKRIVALQKLMLQRLPYTQKVALKKPAPQRSTSTGRIYFAFKSSNSTTVF